VIAWLTKAGAAIPDFPPHAKVETPGGTVLGGTGICCYRALAVVYFSAGPDQPGPIFNAPVVAYVADGGTVVQVQVGGGRGVAPVPSRCQRRRGRDANGVPIGPACFDDQSAAGDQLVVDSRRPRAVACRPGAARPHLRRRLAPDGVAGPGPVARGCLAHRAA